MKNLFTGAQITFNEQMFDNADYNRAFDRDGFRQFMLPELESSIERVERSLNLKGYGAKWEREFTTRSNGVVTMYISGKITAILKSDLESLRELTSVVYGSMKVTSTFIAK